MTRRHRSLKIVQPLGFLPLRKLAEFQRTILIQTTALTNAFHVLSILLRAMSI